MAMIGPINVPTPNAPGATELAAALAGLSTMAPALPIPGTAPTLPIPTMAPALPIPTMAPALPGLPAGSTPANPFIKTQAAFIESASEVASFLSGNVPQYAQNVADALQQLGGTYQTAFTTSGTSVATALQGQVPNGSTPPAAPGMLTQAAVSTGLDNLGQAIGKSIGSDTFNQQDYGVVYAATTIGDALAGVGTNFRNSLVGDITAGLATGATVFSAGADRLAEEITNFAPPSGNGGPSESDLAAGIAGGFVQLTSGYTQAASILTGFAPEGAADGLNTLGAAFLSGAQQVSLALVNGIGQIPSPNNSDSPLATLVDPAAGQAALMGALDPITSNIPTDPAAGQAALMAALDPITSNIPTGPAVGPSDFMDLGAGLASAITSGNPAPGQTAVIDFLGKLAA